MILILSNIANDAAPELVRSFPQGAASLVTASDFYTVFRAGISVNDFSTSSLKLHDREIRTVDIRGVVSTIPCIYKEELFYIEPDDRDYVCAELQAFLVYFLSALECRKLNPPGPMTLSGFHIHQMQWMKKLAGTGIPVWPQHFKNGYCTNKPQNTDAGITQHSIIGDQVVGKNTPDIISTYMRKLSGIFGLPYLSAFFVDTGGGDHALLDIQTVPDIRPAATREAIVDFFQN